MSSDIDEEEQAEIDRKLHELYDVIGTRKINLKTTYIEARDWCVSRNARFKRILEFQYTNTLQRLGGFHTHTHTHTHTHHHFSLRRPKFRAGYARLLKWMCFIMLYFAILYIQSDITPSFEIDEVLAKNLCIAALFICPFFAFAWPAVCLSCSF